ncbi:MAG TPA: molybdopterin molybdotransferase MoeA, partial [Hyphomicrobiaceae bacterium]|nr:molybdopterin molybdotransferase MoeA [Hyphomicrobiaceae bacterium]
MALLAVDAAIERILGGVAPLTRDVVRLEQARGRVLAETLAARLTQPPFDASAMDGFAVRASDVRKLPVRLAILGEAAAGHPFGGHVGPGEAVRIFTGAPVPDGADAIVIQENATIAGSTVTVTEGVPEAANIRRRGYDFAAGSPLVSAGRRLGPRELALIAAMGHGSVPVFRRPRVAVLSTGDELVLPGETPGPGQIVASNHLGVAGLAEQAGAEVRFLGIAKDNATSIEHHVAEASDADILVTIGGASVGDHDLVAPVLERRGLKLDFWKIAMRPGKPLMFGRLGDIRMLGLPGNPVSALICSRVFLVPLIRALQGMPNGGDGVTAVRAAVALEANGPRQHYMRAVVRRGGDGAAEVAPVRSQDSSLLSPLAEADALIVRPPGAAAVPAGGIVSA